ncbi:MAG: GAF domain-containing protein [Deltaproteobacteria bacterium]|nr:GAF domain-containing protein [Deltaproteobacteria bacterium]MBW2064806.1 GAF domain-containing protein [Deltaproteobacteria bacterium]
MEETLPLILKHMDLVSGRIYLLDKSGKSLVLVAHHGLDPGGLQRMRITEGFSGLAARTRSFVAYPVSSLQDRNRASLLHSKGIKYVICVPLTLGEKLAGIMNLSSDKEWTLDDNVLALLTAVGNQLALAAYNAQLYKGFKKGTRIWIRISKHMEIPTRCE